MKIRIYEKFANKPPVLIDEIPREHLLSFFSLNYPELLNPKLPFSFDYLILDPVDPQV